MTHVEIGRTGAKRTAVEKCNPLYMLMDIREKYPQAGKQEQLQRFLEETKSDEEMTDVVVGYTFANLYERLEEPSKRGGGQIRSKQVTDATARMRAGFQRVVEKKAQEMLIDMTMPNGRRLGDCTIAYVQRLGGWLSRIAEGKNPRQTVAHVYDEEQLRALRKAA